MTKSLDPTVLALLATLEERAKKGGEKSIIKGVLGRLASAGANDELIAEISALRPKKAGGAKSVAETKGPRKANGKAKGDVAGKAIPETPTAVG
jgi:hypothetical protein